MNWQTFFGAWWLIGCASILFRNQFVWQEEPMAYRFTLLVLMFPAITSVTAAAFALELLKDQVRFMRLSLDGRYWLENSRPEMIRAAILLENKPFE